jgi:hypothetical protein
MNLVLYVIPLSSFRGSQECEIFFALLCAICSACVKIPYRSLSQRAQDDGDFVSI